MWENISELQFRMKLSDKQLADHINISESRFFESRSEGIDLTALQGVLLADILETNLKSLVDRH